MPLNRLQIIVLGVFCVTLAVWLGLLPAGIFSLSLLTAMLIELGIFAMTYFMSKKQEIPVVMKRAPSAQQRIKQATATHRVQVKTVPKAPVSKNTPPSESFLNTITSRFNKIVGKLTPQAKQGGHMVAAHVNQSPTLWMGIALLIIAGLQFLFAEDNWRLSHMAGVTMIAGIACILYHHNQLNTCLKKLWGNWKVVWLACSVGTIFLWFMHDWEWTTLAMAIVSTMCAIILLGNWQGAVARAGGEVTGVLFQKFLAFCKGDYGVVKILFFLTMSTLAIIIFFYFGGELLFDDEIAQARVWSFVYVVVFLCLMGALIFKIHKKMKK